MKASHDKVDMAIVSITTTKAEVPVLLEGADIWRLQTLREDDTKFDVTLLWLMEARALLEPYVYTASTPPFA